MRKLITPSPSTSITLPVAAEADDVASDEADSDPSGDAVPADELGDAEASVPRSLGAGSSDPQAAAPISTATTAVDPTSTRDRTGFLDSSTTWK